VGIYHLLSEYIIIMSVEIVTYANKSQGMFEGLVNNKFGVPIRVLGWGTKWNGFSDKSKGLVEHLKTKRDDDIVVFIDGFDSKVNRNPIDIVKLFKQYNCKVLFSKANNPGDFILGTCTNGLSANAGMYMGYVKELRQVLEEELAIHCQDDQLNLNTLCKNYNFINIDDKQILFENMNQIGVDKDSDAIFVSYPGKISFDRISRGFVEYTQFIYIYILCLLIIGMGIFPNYSNVFLSLLIGLVLFYILLADKSCTLK